MGNQAGVLMGMNRSSKRRVLALMQQVLEWKTHGRGFVDTIHPNWNRQWGRDMSGITTILCFKSESGSFLFLQQNDMLKWSNWKRTAHLISSYSSFELSPLHHHDKGLFSFISFIIFRQILYVGYSNFCNFASWYGWLGRIMNSLSHFCHRLR